MRQHDDLLKRSKRLAEAAGLTGDLPSECADDVVEIIDGVRSRVGFVLSHL